MDNSKSILLTVAEMSKVLKIGRNKAYELINSNEIQYIKIGKQIRIPMACIENWISKQWSA